MNQLVIVMYHYVRNLQNSRYHAINGLEYSAFREQIEYIAQKFQVITMEELIAAYEGQYTLPCRAALLTFDDGYIDHYNYVFPVLKSHGLQGSFFIPGITITESTLLDVNKIHFLLATASLPVLVKELFRQLDYYRGSEFTYPSNKELWTQYAAANRFDSREAVFIKRILQTVLPQQLRKIISSHLFEQHVGRGVPEKVFANELYMNSEQIKLMKDCGMYIGLHGYDHDWLGNLSVENMESDIDKALETMSGFIDSSSWVMNYPYGSYSDHLINYIASQGCKLGLTTEVKAAEVSSEQRFTLPRFDTNDFPPKSNNYLRFINEQGLLTGSQL